MIEKLKQALKEWQSKRASRAKAQRRVELLTLSGAIRKLK